MNEEGGGSVKGVIVEMERKRKRRRTVVCMVGLFEEEKDERDGRRCGGEVFVDNSFHGTIQPSPLELQAV